MADNSFGIKELNLVGSGTPKIESPTNLNLNAVTVAISTNATVGGTLDVGGVITGDGSGLTGVIGSGSGIAIKHDGSIVGTAGTIDFSTNLDVSAISGAAVTITASGGSTSPGGSNTHVQYNNSGIFSGTSNLTFNGTTLSANTINLTNNGLNLTSSHDVAVSALGLYINNTSNTQSIASFQFSTGCILRDSNAATRLETRTFGVNVTGNLVSDGLVVDGNSDLNGSLDVSGISTFANKINVGTGATIEANGQASFAGIITASNGIFIPESERLTLGSGGQDFRIYNDDKCRIITAQGGDIEIGGTTDAGNNYEYGFKYVPDNQVELTFNGYKKFETTNTGVSVTGNVISDATVSAASKVTVGSGATIEANGQASFTGIITSKSSILVEGGSLNVDIGNLNQGFWMYNGASAHLGMYWSSSASKNYITGSGSHELMFDDFTAVTIDTPLTVSGSNDFRVGSGATINSGGDASFVGVVTAYRLVTEQDMQTKSGTFYGATKLMFLGGNGSDMSYFAGGGAFSDHIFKSMQGGSTLERFRIGADGDIGLSGENYGTSGQVLTSNGAGSAASWTTVSGGGSTLVLNVKDYGAVGDGTTDDTTAIQNALNAGSVFFPAGSYKITSTISLTDKVRSINGVGQQSILKFVPTSNPDNLFEITRTDAESAFFQVSNLRFDTTVADAGYAIKIQETRSVNGDHVVGGVDFLHITDVIFDADGSGYWRGALYQLNAGGTYWTNSSFRNNNSATAQNDTDTKGIYLHNTSPGGTAINYKVIRALTMNNFYIQRAYRAIHVETNYETYGIESIYLDLGEIIAYTGMYFDGSGHIDAISVQNVHMDVLHSAIMGTDSTDVNVIRIIGADLRKGTNGGTTVAGNIVRLHSGRILSIVGTQMGGTYSGGGVNQNGVSLEGDYQEFNIDGGNLFRDLQRPIIIGGTVNNGVIGLFESSCDNDTVNITSINSTSIILDTASGTNDIVTSRWTLGAQGSANYTFTGPGGLSNTADPKIYLARGQTYEFLITGGSSHPFQIQESNGTAYNTGVTNNGVQQDNVVVKFEVPFSAPNTLQYRCTQHPLNMGNTIIIYPDLSP